MQSEHCSRSRTSWPSLVTASCPWRQKLHSWSLCPWTAGKHSAGWYPSCCKVKPRKRPSSSQSRTRDPCDRLGMGKEHRGQRANVPAQSHATCCKLVIWCQFAVGSRGGNIFLPGFDPGSQVLAATPLMATAARTAFTNLMSAEVEGLS